MFRLAKASGDGAVYAAPFTRQHGLSEEHQTRISTLEKHGGDSVYS